jgi:hypothetical protein
MIDGRESIGLREENALAQAAVRTLLSAAK